MDPLIASSVQTFRLGTALYDRAVSGLTREEVLRCCGDSNPMIWIAGHVTGSRCLLASLLGRPVEHPWGSRFSKGSRVENLETSPDISEISAKWQEVTAALMSRFEELTDAELSAESTVKFPVEDRSRRGAIAFFGFHESYHLGQMIFLRKWLGRGSGGP